MAVQSNVQGIVVSSLNLGETHRSQEQFRPPTLADAPLVWQLVRDSGVLDLNSCYLYLLLCRDFAETCLVAEDETGVAGFVTAYRPPLRSESLFIWQVGVAPHARRQGLASRMLRSLLSSPGCRDVQFLEATVSPSNVASRRMFETLARALEIPIQWTDGFLPEHFGSQQKHEAESLLRIGPLERIEHGNL
ncbi:MAG TPA: diaminobutyrate acetyltransferase [Planctomycetaceae bacterium]|nr:diaminobutyrate acetyltransferase [Planctomycetaceae bacterium]